MGWRLLVTKIGFVGLFLDYFPFNFYFWENPATNFARFLNYYKKKLLKKDF